MYGNYKDESKKRKRGKTKDFYATAYLQNSVLTGVSSIVNSKGYYRKVVKTIILVSSVAGFLFQTHGFLNMYWQYSTVASQHPLNSFYRPAITICDENLIRRIYYCEKEYTRCVNFSEIERIDGVNLKDLREYRLTKRDPDLVVCYMFGAYCLDLFNTYKRIPNSNTYKIEYDTFEFFDWNFTKDSGFSLKENLVSCSWSYNEPLRSISDGLLNTTCAEPLYVRGLTKEILPGACYTLDSAIGNAKYEDTDLSYAMGKIVLKWNTSDLINLEPEDSRFKDITKIAYRAYYVSFHNPGELSNPFLEGIRIEERKKYRILLSQSKYTRLPPPYSTHCYDYWNTWRKNNGKGPLSKQDCQELCVINQNLKTYNCVPIEVNYPHEFPFCLEVLPYNYRLNLEIQECAEKCRDACHEIIYKAEQKIFGKVPLKESWRTYNTVSAVHIEVDFNLLTSVETVYQPKYETVEFFSYIGGYLGMWLGWSLMAIFDFFEILFCLGRQLLTGRKKKITNVKKFSVHY